MFTPKTQAVFAVVEVPGDDLVLVGAGFLLDGAVEHQHGVVRLDGADRRLHQGPQVTRCVVRSRQEPGDLIMADLVVQQLRQARRGRQSE
jgi:hypothetical protein